ncbi:MAG: YbaB/EbfC family nucleoid-associated protein [Holosporaceae bacterium]|jgi:DNA-binding YbaB/EbfC family protein|nr:YbaB/EbfC family nucleoid-associated protein [Holosporaceae bacterium]
MNNMNQLMKQAQQMQAKLMETQNRLNELEIVGSSGGNMVTVTLNGKGDMKKVCIDEKLATPEEIEIIADLIVAAHNDAKAKIEAKMAEEMGNFMPAGMKLPF